jgi:citrate synthase
LPEATPAERLQAILPLAGARDAAAYDLRPSAVAATGARLLDLLGGAAVFPAEPSGERLAVVLQRGWRPTLAGAQADRAARLIDAALILSADHELNTSAFTARCVASVRATPYQVVMAALAALQGLRHGGQLARVEALFDETGSPARADAVLTTWLKRGDGLPGFGHPLYPEGDPRARTLLDMTGRLVSRARSAAVAQALVKSAHGLGGEYPTIDFALVAAARALQLPPGAALALFAIGRTAGWIAHAMEQYQAEPMIRPRARYVGPMPE